MWKRSFFCIGRERARRAEARPRLKQQARRVRVCSSDPGSGCSPAGEAVGGRGHSRATTQGVGLATGLDYSGRRTATHEPLTMEDSRFSFVSTARARASTCTWPIISLFLAVSLAASSCRSDDVGSRASGSDGQSRPARILHGHHVAHSHDSEDECVQFDAPSSHEDGPLTSVLNLHATARLPKK